MTFPTRIIDNIDNTPEYQEGSTEYPEHLDEYEILESKIGGGGFAWVHKARAPSGTLVALKVPKMVDSLETLDVSVTEGFEHEARLWSELCRKGIEGVVEIYAYGRMPYPWMALEYMDKGSLEMEIKNISFEKSMIISEAILETLNTAHHYGVIHRDLKPSNILFNSRGEVKLSDWGLGKILLNATGQTMGFKGTLQYSAPEQYNPKKYGQPDWHTDIFQAGATIYHMLAGRPPVPGDLTEAMFAVCNGDIEPLRSVNPDIPEHINNAVMKALHPKKELRWDSVSVFKRVLFDKAGNPPLLDTVEQKMNPIESGTTQESQKEFSIDDYRVNSLGIQFVKIPDRNYYFGKYVVKQKEWTSVMDTTPWKGKDYVQEGDDYPATYVSLSDCRAFIRKLSQMENTNKYRLPIEEEWENACRAGSYTEHYFGDNSDKLGDYAWYYNNALKIDERYAHQAGLKKPNKWGLYDMHGNVWEWTSTTDGPNQVVRGGGWRDDAYTCRSVHRYASEPNEYGFSIGFRLVLEG